MAGMLCSQAELESRIEMYEAQIQKMQKALERADQDQAKLEEELEAAAAPPAAGQAAAGRPPVSALSIHQGRALCAR